MPRTRRGSKQLRWMLPVAAVAAMALLFLAWPGLLAKSDGLNFFMPHKECYLEKPGLLWLHGSSDSVIGFSYLAISMTLVYFVYRKRDLPFQWMFLAFGIFIVACGATHFMELYTLWEPVYWLSGSVKLVTAVASVTTAVLLPPLVPRAMALPSPTQLAKANDELRDANTELNAFAYTISHDLRAPLRAIEGLSTALLEDHNERLDNEGREYLRLLAASAERMDALIQDLLAYSRLSRTGLHLEAITLNAAVTDALTQMAYRRQEDGAGIEIEANMPAVKAHRSSLIQVIANLLSNALKFSGAEPPRVAVSAERRHDFVRLWVCDRGIGIAPEYHERIFQVFQRLHGDTAYPGTGIGLAIVKKGVERMGGRVGVESQADEGSRFWIELPAADGVA